jgi:hypothetical protein
MEFILYFAADLSNHLGPPLPSFIFYLYTTSLISLQQTRVKAATINSSISKKEVWITKEKIKAGELDLLYVALERLLMPEFLELLS